jgi:hypothetical protein
MAYYFIFPEKDTTIYSHPDRLELNSGLDEIIEIVKEKGTTNEILYPSRVLIQFKDSEIESVIKDIIAPSNKSTTATSIFDETLIPNLGNFSCSLQMFSAEHKNLPSSTQLECYALAESWNEGTGRYSNLPTSSNGCSWAYKNNNTDKTSWRSGSTDKPLDPDDYPDWSPSVEFDYIDGTTGSISQNTGIPSAHNTVIGIKPGGGSWYSGSEAEGFSAEQTFTRTNILDTDFDVTSLVQKFSASLFNDLSFPDGLINNGFIIKQPDSIEENTSGSGGDLMYFSTDTHTIYPPRLAFKWDDSIHEKQALAINSGELSVSLYQNKKEYNQNDVAMFRVHVRDKYPDRAFTTTSNYLPSKRYFTTSSYYSIRDANTEEIVIPFDDFNTKMSADSTGMYFKIYMKGLQPERYYRILLKHINDDGTVIYDNDYHFRVIR